jgi:hypothetical protein
MWEKNFLIFFYDYTRGRGDFCNKIWVLEGFGQRFFWEVTLLAFWAVLMVGSIEI